MLDKPESDDNGAGPTNPNLAPFPSYEELAADLLEALDAAGLSIEDVRHEHDPSIGERTFFCAVRLHVTDPPSRYYANLSFTWDALLTYIAAYGPGADCELYHEEDEVVDCPHHRINPQPLVEVEAEFVLGDGGYELHNLDEVSSWLEVVQGVLVKAFPEDDQPSVHVGMASLSNIVLVEKFTAEHSWLLDFERGPDYGSIASQVQSALKVIPQLADRLPI